MTPDQMLEKARACYEYAASRKGSAKRLWREVARKWLAAGRLAAVGGTHPAAHESEARRLLELAHMTLPHLPDWVEAQG